TDSRAAASADALQARAYTVGEHIVLGSGAPPVGTQQGRKLLAHELTHVTQQMFGSGAKRGSAVTGAWIQRDTGGPAPAPLPQPPSPFLKAPTGPGKHENQQVGTWGVYAKTKLTALKRDPQDFGNLQAAVAFARGKTKAACVFEEDSSFIVYPVDYSWFSGF